MNDACNAKMIYGEPRVAKIFAHNINRGQALNRHTLLLDTSRIYYITATFDAVCMNFPTVFSSISVASTLCAVGIQYEPTNPVRDKLHLPQDEFRE